jgi:putative hemolysin
MKKIFILGLLLIISITIIGCNQETQIDIEDETNINNDTNAEIANPASTFCIEQGGDLEIITAEDGEYGMCNFPDGSSCEEWAFFRGECQIGDSNKNENEETTIEEEFDLTELEIECNNAGGQWVGEYYECEYITEDFCEEYSGIFDPCGSACRHEPDDIICTKQCVPYCSLENLNI